MGARSYSIVAMLIILIIIENADSINIISNQAENAAHALSNII